MNDILIKPVMKKDLKKIVPLRKIFFRPEAPLRHLNDISYYSWHNFDNPIKKGSFWAAYHKEKAVGMFSIVPKRISIHSRKYLIGEACDAFIHPNFQGRKIWSRLFKLNYENMIRKEIDLMYASSPTRESYPIFIKKFNFTQLNDLKLFHLIRPLNLGSVIKLKLGSKIPSNLLANLLKFPFNLVFRSHLRNEDLSGIEIQKEMSIPWRYQEFWSKCEGLFDLFFERDIEYIQWRYFLAPEPYEFYTLSRNNLMVGYYVLKVIPWRNLKIGTIVDYFLNSKDDSVFKSMLNEVISSCLYRNIDLIQTWSLFSSPHFRQLVKWGFLPLRKESLLFLNHPLIAALKSRNIKAHFTMGDSDYI
jgi:hypothetical protein